MSIKSLLIEIISKVKQKILQMAARLGHDVKVKETDDLRKSAAVYDEGCSSTAEVKAIRLLEHGGSYPEAEH